MRAKSTMNVLTWNPIVIGVIAGILGLSAAGLTVLASYITQMRQSGNTAAIRQELKDQTEMLRGLIAQGGNTKALEDAIAARARVLAEARPPAASEIQQILRDVPRLTDEYRRLQRAQGDAAGKRLAEFRANWEPLIRFTVGEFDRRVEAVFDSGVKLTMQRDDSYKVAARTPLLLVSVRDDKEVLNAHVDPRSGDISQLLAWPARQGSPPRRNG
jgi:hypothetical protein